MKKPTVTAFIDADILMYRAVSFCMDEWEGEPAGDKYQALHEFDRMLDRWLTEVGQFVNVEDYQLVYTTGKNFRKTLYPDYKANRKEITPWAAMWRFKEELLEYIDAVHEDGIEADDYIGIKVTEDPENRIALSADKDFRTLPIRFYVPASHGKSHGEWFNSSEQEADIYWLRQAMIGDTIDNYKGIPGIGPAKAAKILPDDTPTDERWPLVLDAFKAKGLTEDYALTMVRLARILRHGEYDFDTKEVKLWNPSTTTRTSCSPMMTGW